jgi:hypothetical protein
VLGGIDFQNREGSKFGGGGVMSTQQSTVERRERLRKLAMETIDISKDPYFMRNHLGSYECKLCLTLHTNEGNYLAHTQGKKHQTNLAARGVCSCGRLWCACPFLTSCPQLTLWAFFPLRQLRGMRRMLPLCPRH